MLFLLSRWLTFIKGMPYDRQSSLETFSMVEFILRPLPYTSYVITQAAKMDGLKVATDTYYVTDSEGNVSQRLIQILCLLPACHHRPVMSCTLWKIWGV